jgi:monovalent cation/proton antiporter MnhG/PhaG subunit
MEPTNNYLLPRLKPPTPPHVRGDSGAGLSFVSLSFASTGRWSPDSTRAGSWASSSRWTDQRIRSQESLFTHVREESVPDDGLEAVGPLVGRRPGRLRRLRYDGRSLRHRQLHAASKMVFLAVISLLTASPATGDPEVIYRVVLIGVFLILTTPVSAHLIAWAAFQTGEKMENPGGSRRVRTRAQQRRRVRTVRKALPKPGCHSGFLSDRGGIGLAQVSPVNSL